MPGRVVVRLNPGCSDGDPLHVPPPGVYTQINPPTLYLEKIGQAWMEQRGQAQPGVQYILEALPVGYTVWHRPRPSDSTLFDKYLFGHPSHKRFDSPNRFFPHFKYLMDNDGNSVGCPCTVCQGSSGLLPRAAPNSSRLRSSTTTSSRRSSASASVPLTSRPKSAHSGQVPVDILRPAAQGRPKKSSSGPDASSVDQEGTPDVYRNLIEKLRSHKCIDEGIQEPSSPDWRAEQEILPKLLQTLKSQQQWIPRNGDIVLFVRNLADGITIARHNKSGELRLYDEQIDEFLDMPHWEAGLVTETSSASSTDVALLEPDTNLSVSRSGIRVEPIPDPNSIDKSLSKRYKYVSLRQSRPFFLWKELLQNVDQDHWHPSVKNALALTSTISLIGRYRFRGTWPEATIYCHGIFVGSEMLAVGDTIRLLPKSDQTQAGCTDIMSIKSIRLKWSNLDKASNNDYDEGRPFNSAIWLYGVAYTSNSSMSNKQWASDPVQPRAADDYAKFYPLHPVDKEFAIPFARVAGRLYERSALALFLGSNSSNLINLDLGRRALIEARAFSRRNDLRIVEMPDATWYWGDNRADALSLHTLNGLDVSRFDPERDVKALRKQYRIIDTANQDAKPAMNTAPSGRLSRFIAPTLPARNGKKPSVSREHNNGPTTGMRRGRSIDVNDEENEDEIRQHTRIVDNRGSASKKPKVMVVID